MLCGVRRLWVFIKFWLPPLLWMAAIFLASADSGSVNHSSRLIAPLMRWLFPSMSEDGVGLCVYGVRKAAHFMEFAFCAILLWRALRQYDRNDRRPWTPRHAWLALAMSAAYASTDELHQAFVPGRQPAFGDVLLDSVGAAFGLLLL